MNGVCNSDLKDGISANVCISRWSTMLATADSDHWKTQAYTHRQTERDTHRQRHRHRWLQHEDYSCINISQCLLPCSHSWVKGCIVNWTNLSNILRRNISIQIPTLYIPCHRAPRQGHNRCCTYDVYWYIRSNKDDMSEYRHHPERSSMNTTEASRSPTVNPTITLPLKTVIVTNLFRGDLLHDINHQLTYRCLVWNSWHASISIQPSDWFWAVGGLSNWPLRA